MLMGYHGCHVPLHDLRAAAGASRDGTSLRRLRDLARHYGFLAHAVSCEPEGLKGRPLPLIAFVSFNHMVVVEAIGPRGVRINDPASGPAQLSHGDFDRIFTGVALHIAPGPSVIQKPPAPLRSAILRRAILAAGPWIAATVMAEASVLAAACIALGGSWQAALAIPPLLAASAGVAGRLARRLERGIGRPALDTLLSRDAAAIGQRGASVLAALADSGRRVGRDALAPLITQAARLGATAVPVAALALLHPPPAALATVAGMAACGGLAAATTLRRESVWRQAQRHGDQAAADIPLDTILRAPSVLLGGRDDDLLAEMAGGRAEHSATAARLVTASALHRGATVAIAGAAAATAGATAGPVALALAGLALWPWLRVHQVPRRLLALGQDAALIADIEAAPAARPPAPDSAPPGVLLLDDLRFGHGAAAPPLLDGLSLRLEAGAQIGIAGPVGAGKSTLAALAAGHLAPWAGDIRRGGVVLLVPERPVMVAAPLRDAVTLWTPGIDDAAVRDALQAVRLWEELADRPGGLDQPIEPHGRNLSGGQRRRLGIARALARRPAVLILDETLDGVDLEAEDRLRRHLRQHGITLLLISQRAESLAACDAVWHLEAGRLTVPDTGAAPAPAVSSPVTAAPAPPAPAAPEEWAALARLLAALRLPPLVAGDKAAGDGLNGMRRAVRRSGLLLRRVRLSDPTWSRHGADPLLVRHAGLGWLPVLPAAGGGYRMILPDGRRPRLTDAEIAAIAEDAIAAHPRPLPGRPPMLQTPASLLPSAAAVLPLSLGAGLLLPGLPLAAAVLGVGALALGATAGTLLAGRDRTARVMRGESLLTAHALRLSRRWLLDQGPERLAAWTTTAAAVVDDRPSRPPPPAMLEAEQAAAVTLGGLLSGLPELRSGGGLDAVVAHWQRQVDAVHAAGRDHRRRAALTRIAARAAVIAALGLTAVLPAAAPALVAAWGVADRARAALHHHRLRRRIAPFLAAPTEDDGPMPASLDGTLTAENIHFRYRPDGPAVLAGASLHVAAGEVVAVVGPSGAGKSTLIALLLGLLTPQAGTVRLCGHDLRAADRTALRATCDALFQDEPLPIATARSYLLGNTAHDADAAWAALVAVGLAEEVARWPMGLHTVIDQRSISGGQIQQMRLARTLIRRPRLLILDEATAALDPAVQARVIDALRRRRITTLLTAHRADTLALVDRALRLDGGRLLPLPTSSPPPVLPQMSPPSVAPPRPAPPRIYRRAALDRYDGPDILDRLGALPTLPSWSSWRR